MVYGAPLPEETTMANAVVHFEIPADDVARATKFYEKTFGWTIKAYPMPPGEEYYSVVTRKKDAPGIDGALMKRKMPGQPFTNYINVPSIDDMLQTVLAQRRHRHDAEAGDRPEHGLDRALQRPREQHDRAAPGATGAAEAARGEAGGP